jgi:hypothetical protein
MHATLGMQFSEKACGSDGVAGMDGDVFQLREVVRRSLAW